MAIVARNINKVLGETRNHVLKDISLEIQEGEFVTLTGRSGSGKSTLLYILSSLDQASSGELNFDGAEITKVSARELSRIRNEKVGFVFQFHYLVAELSALENVLLPSRKLGREQTIKSFAEALLAQFGLDDKLHRLPRQLSGGEQQRVAIARALVMRPKYLFADEPTGSLDSVNGERVMQIIRDSNTEQGTTIVMVTHDTEFAKQAKRQIHLVDGRVVSNE